MVSGDPDLVDTLKILARRDGYGQDINPLLYGAWKIRDNMELAPSIDNFLDTHRDDNNLVIFGKIAIARAILTAEKTSKLYDNSATGTEKLPTEKIQETWLKKLFSILVAQRDFQAFVSALKNITFVSFNYDRCIIHFFVNASKEYFSLGGAQIETLVRALHIIHPYGSVGDYSYQGDRSNFGGDTHGENLLNIVDGLRTFTEGAASGAIDEIRSALRDAEILIFLGFSYLPLNMELLVGEEKYPVRHVIGTGKGLSNNSTAQLISELENSFTFEPQFLLSDSKTANVNILDNTCAELFWEFDRFLSKEMNI